MVGTDRSRAHLIACRRDRRQPSRSIWQISERRRQSARHVIAVQRIQGQPRWHRARDRRS